MGSEDTDLMDEGGGGGVDGENLIISPSVSVTCSICFDAVIENGGRSWAKLQCEHKFHLDCIGSAFNVKGVMQCPNCRKIEKGQWLYANGCRSCPDFSTEEWGREEDVYGLSFSEPFGFQWCPFSGLTRISSSFEERELPSTAYHDLFGHHAVFAEHAAATAHTCPYFAYLQPLQPSSSSSNEGIADETSFGHHWSGLSGPSDITFPAVDLHYHTRDHPSPSFSIGTRLGGVDQGSVSSATARSSRVASDGQPISGSFVHPVFLSHGPGLRAGSSVVSPTVPPYPGSNSRSHDRALGHQQQQQPSTPSMRLPVFSNPRRSSGPRAPTGPVASSSDRTNGFYVFPSGSSVRNLQQPDTSQRSHFYAWERDRFAPFPLIPVERESSWWGPFHQPASGLDSGNRSSSVWHSHGSERTSFHSENPPHPQSHPTGTLHPFM
ncbi:hypothetical protein AQUCO_01700175v1 [Aquilegia coerulea]|uniref:RING-type domain-containing protein n=2 Tax=Aquilegia coerulea TaxID=218851 RepID=A0A2G5DLL1_AQUCA|nr:hypothetical protein AQUCO_01700175v1 [Aquilegia coerulea]